MHLTVLSVFSSALLNSILNVCHLQTYNLLISNTLFSTRLTSSSLETAMPLFKFQTALKVKKNQRCLEEVNTRLLKLIYSKQSIETREKNPGNIKQYNLLTINLCT